MCHTTWRHVSILSESESARRERLNTDSTNRRISEEELSLRRITGDSTACTIKFSYQNSMTVIVPVGTRIEKEHITSSYFDISRTTRDLDHPMGQYGKYVLFFRLQIQ